VSPGQLVITDEVYEAAERAALGVSTDVLRAAAPLVAAAELSRIADELEVFLREKGDHGFLAAGLREFIRCMRARAAELRDAAS